MHACMPQKLICRARWGVEPKQPCVRWRPRRLSRIQPRHGVKWQNNQEGRQEGAQGRPGLPTQSSWEYLQERLHIPPRSRCLYVTAVHINSNRAINPNNHSAIGHFNIYEARWKMEPVSSDASVGQAPSPHGNVSLWCWYRSDEYGPCYMGRT